MPLEQFFSEGNKIAVFGSFVYLPKLANDIDFTLFTHGSINPFTCAPKYSEEIMQFLEAKFGKFSIELDFVGRRDELDDTPYDVNNHQS